MKPSITILWGQSPEEDDEPKTYEFDTQAELDAFLLGIAEMDGWMGWREGESINEYRHDRGWKQFDGLPQVPEDEDA